MNRKGPQKHSTETIQKAIALFESGAKLSAIARQFGVQKSTAKYWLDNAPKFQAQQTGPGPVIARMLRQIAHMDLEVRLRAYKVLKEKLPEATLEQALDVLCRLPSQQHSWPALSAASLSKGETERSEVHITVQKFLEKQQTNQDGTPEMNLADAPAEPLQPDATEEPPAALPAAEGGANGAT